MIASTTMWGSLKSQHIQQNTSDLISVQILVDERYEQYKIYRKNAWYVQKSLFQQNCVYKNS